MGLMSLHRLFMKFGLVLLFITLVASVVLAQEKSCKDNSKLVGPCFKIHGRVRIGNGMTIWRSETERVLAVGDLDIIIPDNLSDAVFKKGDIYARDVFGDFEVCPFTKGKEGEMQWVCVESASHLVVKDHAH